MKSTLFNIQSKDEILEPYSLLGMFINMVTYTVYHCTLVFPALSLFDIYAVLAFCFIIFFILCLKDFRCVYNLNLWHQQVKDLILLQ